MNNANKIHLSEIATIIMGQSPKSIAYNKEAKGLPFLQGRTTFGRVYPYFDTWTKEWNIEAKANDILFTVRAPVGDINIAQEAIAIGRGIAIMRPIVCHYKYLFYLLIANKYRFVSASIGTVYDSINKDQLASTKITYHSDEIQRHIVDNML